MSVIIPTREGPFDTGLPRAWMGYGGFSPRGCLVRICLRCPDRAEAEFQVKEAGMVASHGLCPGCYAREMERMGLD